MEKEGKGGERSFIGLKNGKNEKRHIQWHNWRNKKARKCQPYENGRKFRERNALTNAPEGKKTGGGAQEGVRTYVPVLGRFLGIFFVSNFLFYTPWRIYERLTTSSVRTPHKGDKFKTENWP